MAGTVVDGESEREVESVLDELLGLCCSLEGEEKTFVTWLGETREVIP